MVHTKTTFLTVVMMIASCLRHDLACCEEQATPRIVSVSSRDELVTTVQNADPGTKVLIAPGEYRGGMNFSGLHGTKGTPIVLAALDPENPPVFVGGASCIHLTSSSYVELHHLILSKATGNGLNIDDGGSATRPSHHIVLRGLQVRDVGPRGNRDGVKLSGVDKFSIEGCSVERWGDSGSAIDMVGCHEGAIENCDFRYRGDISGNGVQTKGGSSDITIKRCRFENAGSRAVNIGGSTGTDYFRPRSPGYEAKNITVEDCIFIGSMAPIAFVGVDGAKVRYNTIYRPKRWAVRILQESQGAEFVPCRNGSFTNNLIAFRSDEVGTVINVGAGTAAKTFSFAKNHWFCIDSPRLSDRLGLPVVETASCYGQDPKFVDANKKDLRLMSASPVRDAGVRPAVQTP